MVFQSTAGKLLEVNLTDNAIHISTPPSEMIRKVFGGRGVTAWMLNQHIKPDTDPLDPENILILCGGFLSNTGAPASSRLHMGTKSPLNGLLGSSNIGGDFGAHMCGGGIQIVLIRGRAPSPVYLHIQPIGTELADAANLWGLDTWETEERLRSMVMASQVSIMSIGPGGENCVRFACVIHDQCHAAGRTGMGAVMGSKNLKAIVVSGPRSKPNMNHVERSAVKDYIRQIKDSPGYNRFSNYGNSCLVRPAYERGHMSTRNFRTTSFENIKQIDGEKLNEYKTRAKSCPRCPVHCKAGIKITKGKYSGTEGYRPEYESIVALGSKCGMGDTEALLYLNDLCSRLGIDTISTGSVIAFAMDLFDRGILPHLYEDGLELTWGNATAMEKLIRQIVHRKGVGRILSQGVRKAAQDIGHAAEQYAYHVKGVECSATDPRGTMGQALGFAVSARGADYTNVYCLPETRWNPQKAEKIFGSRLAVDRFANKAKGSLIKRCMIVAAAIDCLGICKIPALSLNSDFELNLVANLATALTGITIEAEDLFSVGERVVNLERLFNLKHGATGADDCLPKTFLLDTIDEGPAKGQKVTHLDEMVSDFYRVMSWDKAGVPTKRKLQALGLTDSIFNPDR